MIKVSDIVGALVRSVTMARIQADVMSGQASVEYLKDATLKAFPVPRTEIQKADVDMRLVIADAAQSVPSPIVIAKKSLFERVPALVDRILLLPYQDGSTAKLKSVFGPNATAAAAIITNTVRDRIAQNPMEFTSKWLAKQKAASSKLRDSVIEGVHAAMAALGTKMKLDDVFDTGLHKELLAFSEQTPQELKTATEVATIAGFDLDLAVKKDDLVNVPPHLVSEIKLTLTVDNYEWATSTDAQGNTVNKLTVK